MMSTTTPQSHRITPLQEEILAIYKEVKTVLDRLGLRYYAVGGTCIGAVRHQGFIPWDDDMDLSMPDSDYQKFIAVAKDELPPHLEMLVRSDHPHDPTVAGRVFSKNNTFIERHEKDYPAEYKGVFVDILPMRGLPSNKKELTAYCKRMRRWMRLNEKRRCRFSYMRNTKARLLWLAAIPFRMMPHSFWSDKIYRMQGKYLFDNGTLTGYTWSPKVEQFVFPTELFEEVVMLPFEDTVIPCPKGYDAMLRTLYGDYMTLPPASEQKGLHLATSLIDLEKPYTYYQQVYRNTGTLKKETV